MPIITALEIKEDENLKALKIYTDFFRKSGRKSVYLIPPIVILGNESEIERHISFNGEFHIENSASVNQYGTYFKIKETEKIFDIQRQLGLSEMESGLNLDLERYQTDYAQTTIGKIRFESIIIARYDEFEYKVIKRKRISTGR